MNPKPSQLLAVVSRVTGVGVNRIRCASRVGSRRAPRRSSKENSATLLALLVFTDYFKTPRSRPAELLGFFQGSYHSMLIRANKRYRADPEFRAAAVKIQKILAESFPRS